MAGRMKAKKSAGKRKGAKTKGKSAKKTKKTPTDHCATDTVFEGTNWDLALNDDYGGLCMGEVVLFGKVIKQALFDFCSAQVSPGALHNKNAAQRWFLESGRDFIFVCELAEISADKLRGLVAEAARNSHAMLTLRSRIKRL